MLICLLSCSCSFGSPVWAGNCDEECERDADGKRRGAAEDICEVKEKESGCDTPADEGDDVEEAKIGEGDVDVIVGAATENGDVAVA